MRIQRVHSDKEVYMRIYTISICCPPCKPRCCPPPCRPRCRMRYCEFFNDRPCGRYYAVPQGYTGYVPSSMTPRASGITTSYAPPQNVAAGNNFLLGTTVNSFGSSLALNVPFQRISVLKSGYYKVTYSFSVTSPTAGTLSTMIAGMPETKIFSFPPQNTPYRVFASYTVYLTQGSQLALQLITAPDGSSVTASQFNFSVKELA